MSDKPKFQVGQTLWFVPADSRGGEGHYMTIVSIGRKWLGANPTDWRRPVEYGPWSRINMETLWVDGKGYSSPGRCYLSKEAYEREVALNAAWNELRRLMEHRFVPPKGVGLAEIANARTLLFKDA